MHIGQNIGNATVEKHHLVWFVKRVPELFFSAFQKEFAEQKRFFEEQLFDALFFGFHGHFARDFGIAAITTVDEFVDDGCFARSRSADDDNNFFLHFFGNEGANLGKVIGI